MEVLESWWFLIYNQWEIIYNEAKVIQMHLNGQGVQEFEAFPTLIHVP